MKMKLMLAIACGIALVPAAFAAKLPHENSVMDVSGLVQPGLGLWKSTTLRGQSARRNAKENVSGPPYAVTTRRVPAKIGNRRVDIVIHQSAEPGPTYINVHDDENTAVASALERLRCCGGRLIELRHGGSRYISFRLHGVEYKFDPNRIFTDRGARATLKWLGPYSRAAWEATRRFARKIVAVARLDRLDYFIAVHNNTRGHYSARSYVSGASEARDAAAVYVPRGADPDDFFFVTSPAVYTELHALGRFPVVLQNDTHATDDGSLSIYAAKHGIICLTVEAQEGHLRRQAAMYANLLDGFAVVRKEERAAIARRVVPTWQHRFDNGLSVTGLGAAPQIGTDAWNAWASSARLRKTLGRGGF